MLSSDHPLWDSPHRLFFLLAALWAMLAMGLWLLQLLGIDGLNSIPGGPLLWHAHELLFGFASLAVVGFLLTAVPEFTHTALTGKVWLQRLAWCWAAGRAGWLLSAAWQPSLVLAAIADTLLLGLLLKLIVPPLWQDPARRHLSLVWAVLALLLTNLLFYLLLPHPLLAYQSLHLLTGVLMILILLALARISMSMVNDALLDIAPQREAYLARPPRRNLAMLCIGLYSLLAVVQPGSVISGWLALAAAAAVLNILNDWHIGRALLRRWVLLPYLCLWVIASGYGLQGLGILTGNGWQSAGQHLLLAVAMLLIILYVLLVAGGIHSGWGLDWRKRTMALVALFMLLTLIRSLALFWPEQYFTLVILGGTGWLLCWAILTPLVWRTLVRKPAKQSLANHC
ncbi:MAG: NnrS family protein [Saccharospirillaceae bacterium]|nr:NnrS family protein [Saccharospirillaceae bacterium]MCD8530840.1 NnrS family protein [Saccharospirillaceae bacterium]